jgi:hypothetical protein
MAHLTPHSPEWFAALEAVNPDQAAFTRQIVGLAGKADVCSVCGGDPAQDYTVVGVQFSPNTDATIRLCDDCREIRSKMHGESFSAISAQKEE